MCSCATSVVPLWEHVCERSPYASKKNFSQAQKRRESDGPESAGPSTDKTMMSNRAGKPWSFRDGMKRGM